MVEIQGPRDSQQPQPLEAGNKPTQVPSSGGLLSNITSTFTSIDLGSVWNFLTSLVSISSYKDLQAKRNELAAQLEGYLPKNASEEEKDSFKKILSSHLSGLTTSQLEKIKAGLDNPSILQAFQIVINLYQNEPKKLATELSGILSSVLDDSITKRIDTLNKMVNNVFPLSESTNISLTKPLWEATAKDINALEDHLNEQIGLNRRYPIEHSEKIAQLLSSESGRKDLDKFYTAIYSTVNLLRGSHPKMTAEQFVQITNYLWDKALKSPNDDVFNAYLENVLIVKDPFSLGSPSIPEDLNKQIDQVQKSMIDQINAVPDSEMSVQDKNTTSNKLINMFNEFKKFLKEDILHIELLNKFIDLVKSRAPQNEIDKVYEQLSHMFTETRSTELMTMFQAISIQMAQTNG